MTLYSRPGTKVRTRVKTFYVDDSACEIGGIKHTLLGAISFEDESRVIGKMLNCKQSLGLGPQDEIKWNSQSFTAEQRHFITESLLHLLSATTGFLVIAEEGKQVAALHLATQLSDYCRASGLRGFMCRFDRSIVANAGEFDQHAYSLNPPCAGWSEVDSAHDPLIQFADLFVGSQKLRVDFGLGRADPNKLVEFEEGGERGECKLSFYMFAALRYSLWGEAEERDKDEELDLHKNNLGRGVRVYTTVPREVIADAIRYIEREYMGCIH